MVEGGARCGGGEHREGLSFGIHLHQRGGRAGNKEKKGRDRRKQHRRRAAGKFAIYLLLTHEKIDSISLLRNHQHFFFNLFLCDSLDPFTRTMPPNTSNIAPVISPDECPSLTSERDSKMKDSGFVWSFSDEVSIFLHSGSLGRSSRELGEGDLTLKVL